MHTKVITQTRTVDTHLLTSVTLRFSDGLGPNPFAIWAVVRITTDAGDEVFETMIENINGGVIGGAAVAAPNVSDAMVNACRTALKEAHEMALVGLGYDETSPREVAPSGVNAERKQIDDTVLARIAAEHAEQKRVEGALLARVAELEQEIEDAKTRRTNTDDE